MGDYVDSAYTALDGVILFYEDDDISLNIPDRLGDMEIHAIGNGAFMESKTLEFVSIPAGIKEIGPKAFKGCGNLKCIAISGSIEQIGNDAFVECQNLRKIRIYNYEISEEKYQEMKAYSRCANETVYITPTFPEDKKLREVVNATSAPAANLIQDTIPRLILLEGTKATSLCGFIKKNCYAFDGKASYISEKECIKELMEESDFRTVDTLSEAKNDQFLKNEKEPYIQMTSIFTFNDSKTRHENGKCYLFVEIVMGFLFWQSIAKIIVDSRPYYIYRRHFLSSDMNMNYVRKEIALFNDNGYEASEKEASIVYAKYKLLSIL